MGDQSGVRIGSDSSIEIDFYYCGIRCRERLKLRPTPQNLNYAAKLKASIELEIGKGTFDYRKHFPDSPKTRLFSTVPGNQICIGDYLETWIAVEKQNIRPSTLYGYEKILKHSLNPAFGDILLSELKRKARLGLGCRASGYVGEARTEYSVSLAQCAKRCRRAGVNHIEPT